MMRSALAVGAWSSHDMAVYRSLELYETKRLDFVDAYLLAYAEYGNCGPVATFDRGLRAKAESVGVLVVDD